MERPYIFIDLISLNASLRQVAAAFTVEQKAILDILLQAQGLLSCR